MSARLRDRPAAPRPALPDPRTWPHLVAGVDAREAILAAAQPGPDAVTRAIFAARVALAPRDGLDEALREALQDCLTVLSRDPDPLVRAAMAEALRADAGAPREVVLRLARDREATVATPVLQGSPVLGEAELVALVSDPPSAATRPAIAGRRGLGPALAAAISEAGDTAAIAVLLGNPQATIDEKTLHRLIDAARREPSWQALLATRPALPHDAALALGEWLTGPPLARLVARLDLPSETSTALLAQVTRRLAAAPPEGEDDAAAAMRAHVLHAARLLTDALVQQAARREEERFVLAALKIRSGVEERVIDRIRDRRDPEAVAALAARAGLGAACTAAVVDLLGPVAYREETPARRARQSFIAGKR